MTTPETLCGCGGEAEAKAFVYIRDNITRYYVQCLDCATETDCYDTEAEAEAAFRLATRHDELERLQREVAELQRQLDEATANQKERFGYSNTNWGGSDD